MDDAQIGNSSHRLVDVHRDDVSRHVLANRVILHILVVDYCQHRKFGEHAHELTVGIDPVIAIAIKEAVLKRTTAVAESAGGFLGLNSISDQEQAVLEDIAASFA